ncbi:hypothetical protein BB8028_0006g08880 [Beauveria bassiana]|uniref:Uncharacterized protein n=1 Tax=Beauveria bassiana TaxID=176275 RepID=A0A2S7YKV4_BEABA|nr:hypothetical protein BB8028_0006g08880 [Beauveria bassiana]
MAAAARYLPGRLRGQSLPFSLCSILHSHHAATSLHHNVHQLPCLWAAKRRHPTEAAAPEEPPAPAPPATRQDIRHGASNDDDDLVCDAPAAAGCSGAAFVRDVPEPGHGVPGKGRGQDQDVRALQRRGNREIASQERRGYLLVLLRRGGDKVQSRGRGLDTVLLQTAAQEAAVAAEHSLDTMRI